MEGTIRVLLAETAVDRVRSIVCELERSANLITYDHVNSLADLSAALQRGRGDVILCDWDQGDVDAPAILTLLAARHLDLAVICVAATGDPASAAAALRAGAKDFVGLEDLARLRPVIEREYRALVDRRARRQAELALNERLDIAVAGSQAGFWDWDPRTGVSDYAPSWPRMLGYDNADVAHQDWADLVHPDDRARLFAYVANYLANPSPLYETEFRLRSRDGSYRWLLSRGRGVIGADGKVERLLGLHIDITDRKRSDGDKLALLAVAREISGRLDRQQLLTQVQRRILEVLPCDFIATFTWNARRQAFRCISHCGNAADLAAELDRNEFPLDDAVRRQFRSRSVVVNDLVAQSVVPHEVFTAFGVTAIMATPLRHSDQSFDAGLLAYSLTPGTRFDAAQVELFEAIGRQLAVALEAADKHETQLEAAEVAGALARFGQEVISSLDEPGLLERVCRLTTEVLSCDASHTAMWQKHGDVFAAVAGAGYPPELWDIVRAIRVPRAALGDFLERLSEAGAMRTVTDGLIEPLARALAQQIGVRAALLTPLRCGNEIVGMQISTYFRRDKPFSLRQEKVARGISVLASLALQHATLLEELGRANRLKSEFLASMSHELRTPLNIVLGYSYLLLAEDFGPLSQGQRRTLQKMEESTQALGELIGATLDLSRLEAGQAPLELAMVSILDFLRELEGETQRLKPKARLQFPQLAMTELPRLRTDGTKLKVIAKNLIGNAVKFTPQGEITVTARSHKNGVELLVSDTGVGISHEILPTIFDPFRQGDGSYTRIHGGVGLGLYVVRRLLEQLGGTIAVDSEPGCGSTFSVWVPHVEAPT